MWRCLSATLLLLQLCNGGCDHVQRPEERGRQHGLVQPPSGGCDKQVLDDLLHTVERDEHGEVTEILLPLENLSDAHWRCLAHLKSLRVLRLQMAEFDGANLRWLSHLRQLNTLDISGTAVGDDDVAVLASVHSLQALSLDDTRVTDRTVSALRKLPGLRALSLRGTKVTDQSIDVLVAMSALRFVALEKTNVSPAALRRLRDLRPDLHILPWSPE